MIRSNVFILLVCFFPLFIHAQSLKAEPVFTTAPIVELFKDSGQGYDSYLLYYSYVGGHLKGQRSTIVLRRDPVVKEKRVGIRMTNVALIQMIAKAYFDKLYTSDLNRFIVESSRKSQIIYPQKTDFKSKEEYKGWIDKNTWFYDLKVPLSLSDSLYVIMQEDIKKYFNLEATVEKRKVKCLTLIQKEPITLKPANGESVGKIQYDGKTKTCKIRNGKMNTLVYLINKERGSKAAPTFDATNFKNSFDIDIKSGFSDLRSLRQELLQYGIDLVEEEHEIDMIIVRDVKY